MPPTPQGGGGGLRRLSKLFSSCSSGFGGSDHAMAEAGMAGPQPASPSAASASGSAAPPVRLQPEELGEPDCLLVGAGWTIPVHRCGGGKAGPAHNCSTRCSCHLCSTLQASFATTAG